MTIGEFSERLAIVGKTYRGSVISWGRSKERNHAVGGHKDSFHLHWLAADVVFDNKQDFSRAARLGRRIGLHVKRNGTLNLHLQAFPPEGFVNTTGRIMDLEKDA